MQSRGFSVSVTQRLSWPRVCGWPIRADGVTSGGTRFGGDFVVDVEPASLLVNLGAIDPGPHPFGSGFGLANVGCALNATVVAAAVTAHGSGLFLGRDLHHTLKQIAPKEHNLAVDAAPSAASVQRGGYKCVACNHD